MEEHAELEKEPESVYTSSFPPALEYDGIRYPPRVITPEILDGLKAFEVRDDDIILTSYPKCGTHWIQEILLLIQQDGHVEMIKRDVDPALNWDLAFGLPPNFEKCVADSLATRPSPRFYKTHLPSQHLPPQVWSKKAKLVYITRDPKDACASFFNFTNANPDKPFEIQWDMFFDLFMSDKAIFGNWVDHALGYWRHRNDDHVFFITFEEMKEDIRAVIRRLATFLGKTISPEGLERIVEHSSLEGMKRTYAKIEEEVENGKLYTRAYGLMSFVQKGVPGGWKALFSEEQKEKMDKTMKERLVETGLDAHYPLNAPM